MAGKTSSAGAEIGGRYAAALFDLAADEKALDAVEKDLVDLSASIDQSEELRNLITNPLFAREDQQKAIVSVLEAGNAHQFIRNVAGLMAHNGRLFALPAMINAFRKLAADARGEVSAEAVTAVPLTEDQVKRLRAEIEASVGKAVNLETRTDESLLGGLIVKVGSRMVDTSLRTKLTQLKMSMKEA
ncbi:MAG: F0F1 ATP synthase subunit delta [Aquisalinus sp.]|nr:F0F1 ATP synthase subunit delta [Aquisalinus sp.]